MNGEEQVIENAHAGEERGRLKRPGHTKMGPLVDRELSDVTPHKIDLAGIR